MLLPTECFSQCDTGVLKTCHRFYRKSDFPGGRGGGSPARLDPRLRCTTRLPRADRLGEWPRNGGDARRKRPAAAAAVSPHSSAASPREGCRRLPAPSAASGGLGWPRCRETSPARLDPPLRCTTCLPQSQSPQQENQKIKQYCRLPLFQTVLSSWLFLPTLCKSECTSACNSKLKIKFKTKIMTPPKHLDPHMCTLASSTMKLQKGARDHGLYIGIVIASWLGRGSSCFCRQHSSHSS